MTDEELEAATMYEKRIYFIQSIENSDVATLTRILTSAPLYILFNERDEKLRDSVYGAFVRCCSDKQLKVMELLAGKGFNFVTDDCRLLMTLSDYGRNELVTHILSQTHTDQNWQNIIKARSKRGFSLMHTACLANKPETINRMIRLFPELMKGTIQRPQPGFDAEWGSGEPNRFKASVGDTPLLFYVKQPNIKPEVLTELLNHSQDVLFNQSVSGSSHKDALLICVENKSTQAIECIIEQYKKLPHSKNKEESLKTALKCTQGFFKKLSGDYNYIEALLSSAITGTNNTDTNNARSEAAINHRQSEAQSPQLSHKMQKDDIELKNLKK